jgi:hypothetical protein
VSTSSTDLVPLDWGYCPVDRRLLTEMVVAQPALFRHGGYGADQVKRYEVCRCGYARLVETTEERPWRR